MNQDRIWNHFQTQGLELFLQSVPRLNFLLEQGRRQAHGKRLNVLNIGVGDGWLELKCGQQGWNAYALDPSQTALSTLRKSGVKGAAGYVESIPYIDGFFDIVFCSELIEHLSSERIERALSEIQRVLRRSGVLLGTVPFKENLFAGQVACPSCGKVFHRLGHLQSFDLPKLTALFPNSLQLEKIATTYFADWSRLNWKGKLLAVLKKGLLLVGVHGVNENIYFVARKKGLPEIRHD